MVVLGCCFSPTLASQAQGVYNPPLLENVIITGSETLPIDTIRSKVPYHKGEIFWNYKTNEIIKNIYSLGYYKQIEIKEEQLPNNKVNLHIVLTEKPLLEEVIFVGNKNLSEKDINKKINFEKIPAADEKELQRFAKTIAQAYAEKSYHFADISVSTKKGKKGLIATFTIHEGHRSLVKRVCFEGNTEFHGKALRSLLFTREDWLLGALDKAGTYHPQALEADKYTLENFYQSNGFMNARVTDARVDFDKKNKDITVTFVIHEGDKYTISDVSIPGNDIYTEEQLLSLTPVRPGQLYSRELIRLTMERLRTLWGDKGYIYSDIEPSIEPNEENKTVKLSFYSELGEKVRLNKINIYGNEKTRDKVIRRQILLDEGDYLSSTKMDISKDRVGGLGYFDPREGVNWKLNRIDEDLADLDLLVKEIKTGRAEFKITYGGTPGQLQSTTTGVAAELHFSERNIGGQGLIGHFMGRYGQEDQGFNFNFAQPWLFDRPIRAGFDAYYTKSLYDEIRRVVDPVQEQRYGGAGTLGFMMQRWWDTSFLFQAGVMALDLYSSSNDRKVPITASIVGDNEAREELQAILNRRFETGKFTYLQLDIGQDTRNHVMHISRGYQWTFMSKLGVPSFSDNFGFIKFQFDGHWYTPIIDERQLVLHLRGHLGFVNTIGNHAIPFRELYNIGGQASVRGWLFGQIGPVWYTPELVEDGGWQGDPIGSQKAFFMNAELIFPITKDMGIKGVVFYDGGAGWDTPDAASISPAHLKNNSFKFRHAIGIGLRLLNPQPMRIDWGFKLDRETGETAGELNFSSYYDF